MFEEFAIGILLGVFICYLLLKLREMKSDIDWCRVYVDQHLNKEQKEALS